MKIKSESLLTFKALEMITSIRKAFNGLLEDIDWMDDKTRKVAEEKVKKKFSLGDKCPKKNSVTDIGAIMGCSPEIHAKDCSQPMSTGTNQTILFQTLVIL